MTAAVERPVAAGAPPASGRELLRQWRAACAGWRLSRGDAAKLLRIRRNQLVGTVPDAAALPACTFRMQRLVMLARLLEERTRSPAQAARWVRFPCITDPSVTRIERLITSDPFLDATLRLLGHREKKR